MLTLQGKFDSDGQCEEAQKIATGVPNLQQVINELQVKGGNRAGE